MVNCCVPNCRKKNVGGCGFSFHHFPLDSTMVAKWVLAISRKAGKPNPHWKPTKHSVVCSKHFKETDYSTSTRRNILLPHAVPSVFSKDPAEGKMLEETQIGRDKKNVYTIPSKNKINRLRLKPTKVWLDTETIVRELGYDFLNEMTEERTVKLEKRTEHIPIEEDTGEEYIVNECKTEQNWEETALSTFLCRLCATSSEDVISIFEYRQSKSVLLEKIHTYLPIMITPEDLLPTTVCKQCVNKLEVCHNLVQGCLDADAVLKTMFGLQNSNQVDYGSDNQFKDELILEENNICEEYEDLNNTELPDNVNEEQSSNQFDDQNGNIQSSNAVDLDKKTKASAVNENVIKKKPKQVKKIKPKLKVVIVKMKNMNNVTDKVELQKALQLAINEKLKQHTPASSQEHKFPEKPSVIKHCTDSGVEISKFIDREQNSGQNNDEIGSDHTYTFKICCQHCQQSFINKEELLLHQQTSKQCHKSKEALDKHFEVCYDDKGQAEDKENRKLNGSDTANSNEIVLEQEKNEVVDISSNNFKEDTMQNDMEVEVLDVDIKTDIKPGMFKLDEGCHIKFPKGFEHITSTHQTKILSAIDKIIEKKLPKPKIYPPRVKGPNGWECKVCHETFPTMRVYRLHRKTHVRRPFPCTKCERMFTSEVNLKKHLDLHSVQRTFMCEYCGKIFKLKYSLKLHYISHGKREKIHKCSECGKTFGSRYHFTQHRLFHGTANYLCDICGKILKYPGSLRSHKSLHKQKILYECATCGKKYNNSQGMKIHTQTHIREAPFGCDRCGKHFRSQFNLTEHKLSHANTTSCICYICGKCFKFRMQLKRHITRHQLTLKYTCKQCHVTFTSMKKLLIHRRRHTSVKIENCQVEEQQLTAVIL